MAAASWNEGNKRTQGYTGSETELPGYGLSIYFGASRAVVLGIKLSKCSTKIQLGL